MLLLRIHIVVLLVLGILFCKTESHAQGRATHWYFADNCGLRFDNTGVQVLKDGKIPETEGTASISDASGQLLFYANPEAVWDRRHNVMPNGQYLLGGASCTQGALILPKPGSGSLFYVFTLDEFQNYFRNGMRYSIVDMCLNEGLGDIPEQSKNILLLDTCGEKMAATRHANGKDYWILVHSFYSDAFHAFRLTENGLSNHVVSRTGKIHGDLTQADYINSMGQMKISPDGKRVALANRGKAQSFVEVFDFDNATGRVSAPRSAPIGPEAYGIAFSPDNNMLYLTEQNMLSQYDLSDIEQPGFSLSQSRSVISIGQANSGMQLGPNGKIYVNCGTGTYIGCISQPNKAGADCAYNPYEVFLEGLNQWMTFPSFVDNFRYANDRYCCRCSNGIDVFCLGDSAAFALTDSLPVFTSITWTIRKRDGTVLYSGNRFQPRIKLSQPDSVWAEAAVNTAGGILRYTAKLYAPAAPQIDFPSDTMHFSCMSEQVRLRGPTGNYIYQWDLGGFSSSTAQEVILTPNMKYVRLKVTNVEGCTSEDIMYLDKSPGTKLFSQHQYCLGNESILLRPAISTLHYKWQDGSSVREFRVTQPGKYWVKAYNSDTCTFSDTVWVWSTPPTDILPPNQRLCYGKVLPIDAGPWDEITWHDGSHLRYRNFSEPGKIWLKVKTPCGEVSDSCIITFNPPLPPAITIDTALCAGSFLTLDAPPGCSYTFNGRSEASIVLKEPGTYLLYISTDCEQRTDTVRLRHVTIPTKLFDRKDTTLCQGQSWEIKLQAQDYRYLWGDGENKPTRRLFRDGLYTLTAWNACGTTKDSVRVRVDSCICYIYIPNAFTPNDDGINQYFQPQICQTVSYQFIIFNRWGERIFETDNPSFGWDGQFKGAPSPIGLYIYRVIATDYLNRPIFINGQVYLVR